MLAPVLLFCFYSATDFYGGGGGGGGDGGSGLLRREARKLTVSFGSIVGVARVLPPHRPTYRSEEREMTEQRGRGADTLALGPTKAALLAQMKKAREPGRRPGHCCRRPRFYTSLCHIVRTGSIAIRRTLDVAGLILAECSSCSCMHEMFLFTAPQRSSSASAIS